MFYTRLRFSSSKLSVYCPMKPLTVNEIKDFIPLKRVFVISLDLESCTLAGFRQWLMLQLRWYKCTLATSLLQLTKNLSPCFKIRAVQCEYGLSKSLAYVRVLFAVKLKNQWTSKAYCRLKLARMSFSSFSPKPLTLCSLSDPWRLLIHQLQCSCSQKGHLILWVPLTQPDLQCEYMSK